MERQIRRDPDIHSGRPIGRILKQKRRDPKEDEKVRREKEEQRAKREQQERLKSSS